MSLFDDLPPHDFPDRAIRRLLEVPANLRDFIAVVLPDLVDQLDFEHVEEEKRQFLLDNWRRRESDMLFRIPFRTGSRPPILICLLIEHQSEPDDWMPLRLLLYAVLYWDRQWKAWEETPSPRARPGVTPIIPIVLHTGHTAWRKNRVLAELMDAADGLDKFAPVWPAIFWNLEDQDSDQLVASAGAWLAAMAVVRAERAEAAEFRRIFTAVLQRLEPLGDTDPVRWHDLLYFILSWGVWRRSSAEGPTLFGAARECRCDVRRREELTLLAPEGGGFSGYACGIPLR